MKSRQEKLTKRLLFVILPFGLLLMPTGCTTVVVHRAALVQPPTLPMWSGRTKPTGFSAGNSTMLWNNAPKNSTDSDSGLYVSSTQFDGTFHIQLGPTQKISLWLPMSYGLTEKSFAAAPCMVSRPISGTMSGGIGIGFTSEISRLWYIGTSIETMLALIPSHIKVYGDDPYSDDNNTLIEEKEDYSLVPVLRWSGAIGVDFDWVRLFGSLGLRNHPTNTKITREVLGDNHGDVRFGPIYALLGVGAEFNLGKRVSILAQLYQPLPLYDDDVIYGPMAGVTLDLHSDRSPE